MAAVAAILKIYFLLLLNLKINLEIYFAFLLLNQKKPTDSKLGRKYQGDL